MNFAERAYARPLTRAEVGPDGLIADEHIGQRVAAALGALARRCSRQDLAWT
jgi:hypothetical protein